MRLTSRVLRIVTAVYMFASMLYFVSGPISIYDRYFRKNQYVHEPFEIDYDTLAVSSVNKEAEAAGLRKGEVIESLDDQPYRGEAQWKSLEHSAHPGEVLTVGTHSPSGAHHKVHIRLTPMEPLHWSFSQWFIIVVLQLLCCLICLFTGYWVVLAKPHEPNAWLILLLLSFPEVMFSNPDWWTGAFYIFLAIWYNTLQVAGPLVVLLIGIYFPERWRLDRKLPWLKWLLLLPAAAGFVLILIGLNVELYLPKYAHLIGPVGTWVGYVVNSINLICVLFYWIAIIDKLRSASTADARRRMRVLCAGSLVGLGALLIVFVFLRDFGIEPSRIPWLAAIGASLTLLFPFSLAYVVVVQRALDVRILVRMGTKYLLARATLGSLQIILLAVMIWYLLAPLLFRRPVEIHKVLIPALILVLVRAAFGKAFGRWLDRRFFREAYTAELVLSELSEEARTHTETHFLLSNIAKRISGTLHVPQIGVLLRGGHFFQLQQAVGLDLLGPVILSENSQAVQNLIRENRPATLYRESREGWFAQAGEDEKQMLNAVNAEILLPLPGRERLMGLMTLGPKLSEEPYSPSDLRLLHSVGTQAGLALEVSDLAHSLANEAAQRERINREIEIAREVQERLFPQTTPQLPGTSLAGFCRPALAVGGDYYDFIELEDGRLALAIGDVSGKGIGASLVMASLRASLRGMMLECPQNLGRLMSNINRLVYEASTSNRYATFFFCLYDGKTSELHYVNAGHNPPILLRGADGEATPEIVRLEAGGPVVGLLPNLSYEERSITLKPADLLVTFTDGISEAMTVEDEEWGEERMIEAVRRSSSGSASEIVNQIFVAADEFTGKAPQHDDMTLLILKLDSNRKPETSASGRA